jgi:hypothetical protein
MLLLRMIATPMSRIGDRACAYPSACGGADRGAGQVGQATLVDGVAGGQVAAAALIGGERRVLAPAALVGVGAARVEGAGGRRRQRRGRLAPDRDPLRGTTLQISPGGV